MPKPEEVTAVESEINAASALADLKEADEKAAPQQKKNSGVQEEAEALFDIPQKFTKSGRKRAVPFTIKVSISGLFEALSSILGSGLKSSRVKLLQPFQLLIYYYLWSASML